MRLKCCHVHEMTLLQLKYLKNIKQKTNERMKRTVKMFKTNEKYETKTC